MSQLKSADRIRAAIKEELSKTKYAASSLQPLTGGTANYIYCAKLEKPLPSGLSEVLVKHGEGYVAHQPDITLTRMRCEIEVESLRLLSDFPPETSASFEVGTPKMFYFNGNTSTQVQECLKNALSLKDYALKHCKSAPPPDNSTRRQCKQLGRCLGQWLRAFHNWTDGPGKEKTHALFSRNTEMQGLKKSLNYDQLLSKVEVFPALLQEHREALQQIADMATAELQDPASLKAIHGDFWTGNILLPDSVMEEGTQIPVRIVDWEMAQLGVRAEDAGQLMAELWQLKLYKDIDAGLWIIEGFVDGYGRPDGDFAWRTLLHVGAHLVCFGSSTPGWGTAQQNLEIARAGRDVLLGAWTKDEKTFEGHDLACLLAY